MPNHGDIRLTAKCVASFLHNPSTSAHPAHGSEKPVACCGWFFFDCASGRLLLPTRPTLLGSRGVPFYPGFGGFSMEIGGHFCCVCCCEPELRDAASRIFEVPEALPRLGRPVFGGPGGHFSHGQAHKSQFIRFSDKTLQKDLRGRFASDEAEDAGGLDAQQGRQRSMARV